MRLKLLLLSLLLTGCATALPLQSVDPLPPGAVFFGQVPNPCGEMNSMGAIFRLDVGDKTYKLLLYGVDQRQSRFILLDTGEGDDTPVWLGVVRPDGTLDARAMITYTELLTRYPDMCTYFTQQDA